MEAETRVIHWYDTQEHRIACGAPGQSNSTKHVRGVTCSACLACIAKERATRNTEHAGASYVH